MTVIVRDAEVVAGEITLLAPISLTCAASDIVAIRGANGAGKTTLLRAISGAVPLRSGSITIAGEPASDRSPTQRRRIAALIGLPPLARDLTLTEHLGLIAASWGIADEAATLLSRLRLGDLAQRFPHELSSGQTQLFALAIVLTRPSEVLLLDEPEQRLDAERTDLVAALLRERAARGTTVILATHSDRLVAALSARELQVTEAQ